jgi:isopenicillin-N epimerase
VSGFAQAWPLDPDLVYLNHGSFGSCPRTVLERQAALRERLERSPMDFLLRELEPALDEARGALAALLGARPDDLVLVPNATAGVNSVLRSLELAPGDELLVTDHEYNACRNALEYVAARSGARVVVAPLPFPVAHPDLIVEALLRHVGPRTRLLLIDHVTSQTALVLPVARIVRELAARGIDTLVDGAHAPGMLPLALASIGAAYYTGNCHKWLCAPKVAGFLYVRPDRAAQVRPWLISHGANSPRRDRSRLQLEFGWAGTWDPSAMLCIPAAIDCVGGLLPGGWPELMARNHALALDARALLCAALGIEVPCPASMLGSMAAVPLMDAAGGHGAHSALDLDPLQERLRRGWGIEVPVVSWPAAPRRLLRVSAQLYNTLPQYRLLAQALRSLSG